MDYRILIIAPIAALVLSAGAAAPRLPAYWMPTDLTEVSPLAFKPSQPIDFKQLFAQKGYEIGLDPLPDASGLASLSVRFVAPPNTKLPGIGAAHQQASGYAGQRVRLNGQVRVEGVRGWAGLYIGAGENDVLGDLFSGTAGIEHRLPQGAAATSAAGWQDVSVVFDVPADAPVIDLGLALVGEGQVWARALRFEVVGQHVPVTTMPVPFDWAKARDSFAKSRQGMARIPPMPLFNAALD
jgi:hypothetical protein